MTPAIDIRLYREGDQAEVARVWFEGSVSSNTVSSIPEDLHRRLYERIPTELRDGWALFVATEAGRIVGMLALKPRDDHLHELFVDPAHQNRGVGKALLDYAKSQMPRGFWLRTMANNLGAKRFYSREGMHRREDSPHPSHPEVEFSTYVWSPPHN